MMAPESAQNHSRVTPPLSMPASPMKVTLIGCRQTAMPLPENWPMLSLKHLGHREREKERMSVCKVECMCADWDVGPKEVVDERGKVSAQLPCSLHHLKDKTSRKLLLLTSPS
jgi:hypothetical protein